MNSSIHFPGQGGQSWACWEILPPFGLRLPSAPPPLLPDAGLGWRELKGRSTYQALLPLIPALTLAPFGLGPFAWLLHLSFSIYKMGIMVFTYLPHE